MGRYQSKLLGAVAFARYMRDVGPSHAAGARGPSSQPQYHGNMVLPTVLPEATEGGTINRVEKILDVRDVELPMSEEEAHAAHRADLAASAGRYIDIRRAGADPAAAGTTGGEQMAGGAAASRVADSGVSRQPLAAAIGDGNVAAYGGGRSGGEGGGRRGSGRHTKSTLAAVAAGVPFTVGVLRRTRDSIAASVRRPPERAGEEAEEASGAGGANERGCGDDDAPASAAVAPVSVHPSLYPPATVPAAWLEAMAKAEAEVSPMKEVTGVGTSGAEAEVGVGGQSGVSEGVARERAEAAQTEGEVAEEVTEEVREAEAEAEAEAEVEAEVEVEGEAMEEDAMEGAAKQSVHQVRQYLCKLRAHSYARCVWLRADEIEEDGKLSNNCLKRFLRRLSDGEEIDESYRVSGQWRAGRTGRTGGLYRVRGQWRRQ